MTTLIQDDSGQWGTFTINNVYPIHGRAEYAYVVGTPTVLGGVAVRERVRFEAGRMKANGTVASREPWRDGYERLRLTNVIVEGK